MNRKIVRSLIAAAAEYGEASQAFEIEYFNGFVYILKNVPKEIALSALNGENFDEIYRDQISGLFEYEFVEQLHPLSVG